jgi:prepilin-type N-terminal cleavage/methylation domain-containing protein
VTADRPVEAAAGFTLVEVLAALALIGVGAAGVAGLLTVSMHAGATARHRTSVTTLAMQKVEQLRSLSWSVDAAGSGLAVSDLTTDTSVDPPAGGGGGLSASPPSALVANTPGYVDFLDGGGTWLAGGASPPAGAVYVRRWSVSPLARDPQGSVVVQVLVTTLARDRAAGAAAASQGRLPDAARLVTAITRKAR